MHSFFVVDVGSRTFWRTRACQRRAVCMRCIARAKHLRYWGVSWAVLLQCIQSTWRRFAIACWHPRCQHPFSPSHCWCRPGWLIAARVFSDCACVRHRAPCWTPKISPVRMPSAKLTRCRPVMLPGTSSVGWGYMGCSPGVLLGVGHVAGCGSC